MWFTCQPLLVSSSIFANQYIWKRPWCWEGLGAGGKGDNRGWDGWMASPTQWTWVWVNSRSWWWPGRPGVLRFMGSQRVGHDWATELNWHDSILEVDPLQMSGVLCPRLLFWCLTCTLLMPWPAHPLSVLSLCPWVYPMTSVSPARDLEQQNESPHLIISHLRGITILHCLILNSLRAINLYGNYGFFKTEDGVQILFQFVVEGWKLLYPLNDCLANQFSSLLSRVTPLSSTINCYRKKHYCKTYYYYTS